MVPGPCAADVLHDPHVCPPGPPAARPLGPVSGRLMEAKVLDHDAYDLILGRRA